REVLKGTAETPTRSHVPTLARQQPEKSIDGGLSVNVPVGRSSRPTKKNNFSPSRRARGGFLLTTLHASSPISRKSLEQIKKGQYQGFSSVLFVDCDRLSTDSGILIPEISL